jgi:hypothetical protein
MKRTRWIPCTTPPVRIGVYERRFNIGGQPRIGFSRWDGSRWGLMRGSVAAADGENECAWQVAWQHWRGITRAGEPQ